MARRKPLPELPRIYVRPNLDRRMRIASRDFCRAAFHGKDQQPAPDTVDPLWMRMGMRAFLIEQRAGWVVSSLIYDDHLTRHPRHDPSLPDPGWLQEVYRWQSGRELCLLPRVRAVVEARLQALRKAEERQQRGQAQPVALEQPAQAELF